MTQISNLYSKASFLMSHRLLHWVRDKQLIQNEKWSLISLHKCDPARNSQILLKLQKTWNCEPGQPELTQTWWDIQGTALCRIFGLLWRYEEGRVSPVLTQAQSDTDFKPLKSELFHQLYNFIDSPIVSFIKWTEGVVQIVGIVKPTEVLYLQKHLIHLFNFFPLQPSRCDFYWKQFSTYSTLDLPNNMQTCQHIFIKMCMFEMSSTTTEIV